jgi:hypothetical protein
MSEVTATTNLGRVSIVPKGDYDATVQYSRLDVVKYNRDSYLAKTSVQGVTPGTDATKWMLLVEGAMSVPEAEAIVEDLEDDVSVLKIALKNELLELLKHVAYTDQNGLTYYNAFRDALDSSTPTPTPTLSSIRASFNPGTATIYESTSLDSLKQYLTVTATYSDSSTETVASTDYTLSGTLTAGTSTITVSYGGKTTTFTVTVTASPATLSSISAVLNLNGNIVRDGDSLDSLKQYLTVTATYSDSSTAVVNANDYTLSGSLALSANEYDASQSTITVSFSGKTTTFVVTVHNAMTANRVTLPSGYTQLVMIKAPIGSNATSRPYINTGINGLSVDHVEYGIQCHFNPSATSNFHILSSKYVWYPYFRRGGSGSLNFQVKNRSTSGATGLSEAWTVDTNYVIEAYPDVKINGVTVTTVASGGVSSGDGNLFINARPTDSGYADPSPTRWYYIKMFDDQNQLTHQFIPCKNSSDVVGMYDTVEGSFYTSANEFTFVAGEAI